MLCRASRRLDVGPNSLDGSTSDREVARSGPTTPDGDEDDVDQGVFASALDAGILEILEVVSKGGRSVVGHWVLLSECDWGLTRAIPCTDGAFANLLDFASLMREPWGRPPACTAAWYTKGAVWRTPTTLLP